jgi:hypothetical protein
LKHPLGWTGVVFLTGAPEPLLERLCWGVGALCVWGLKRCGWNERYSCKFCGYFHHVHQDGTETDSAENWSEHQCYSLTVHVTRTWVSARQFLPLAFRSNCLVHLCLEIWKVVTLQLIVKRPNQPIQKPFLSLRISVYLIRCITRQMSELVQVLNDRHASLPWWQELLLLKLDYPWRDVIGTEVVMKLLPSDILPVAYASHQSPACPTSVPAAYKTISLSVH